MSDSEEIHSDEDFAEDDQDFGDTGDDLPDTGDEEEGEEETKAKEEEEENESATIVVVTPNGKKVIDASNLVHLGNTHDDYDLKSEDYVPSDLSMVRINGKTYWALAVKKENDIQFVVMSSPKELKVVQSLFAATGETFDIASINDKWYKMDEVEAKGPEIPKALHNGPCLSSALRQYIASKKRALKKKEPSAEGTPAKKKKAETAKKPDAPKENPVKFNAPAKGATLKKTHSEKKKAAVVKRTRPMEDSEDTAKPKRTKKVQESAKPAAETMEMPPPLDLTVSVKIPFDKLERLLVFLNTP